MQILTDQQIERDVYSVSRLNHEVRSLLEEHYFSVWVEGEVSNLARPGSGHWYFSLKDPSAQVRCAMFRGANNKVPFELEDGQLVRARARVSLYEGRGEFQLIVDTLEESGDGALKRAFEKLKVKLQQEGLFDPELKKLIPTIPRCVGVITSHTGAAVKDVLTVLKRRFAGIPVIVYPTLVQGEQAPSTIIKAITTANQRQECDVILLVRGGGSLEDLWAFNDEQLARAIFASDIPIVSGVGHEIDFTIADFVADHRAATPTAAAEAVSPCHLEWLQTLYQLKHRLAQKMQLFLQHQMQLLQHLRKRLVDPRRKLQDQAQRLDESEARLIRAMQQLLANKKHLFTMRLKLLETLSPLATLTRGYAIVSERSSNKILTDTKGLSPGQEITARLAKGEICCTIDAVIK